MATIKPSYSTASEWRKATGKLFQRGYSLIELIVVITLLGILGIGAVGLFFSTLKGSGKASVLSEVKQQGDFALIAIERAIRNSIRVESCTETELVLEQLEGAQKTIASSEDTITIDGQQLVGEGLMVTEFLFTCIDGNRAQPDVVTVEFSLQKGNPQVDKPENMFEEVFQTTVTLRNY